MTLPVRSAAVTDFQSIADAEIEFGKFTVLVGRSSSGKSSFLRAVRACTRNTFAPANVRSGRTKSSITVELDGVDPVTIERGKSLSTYHLGAEAYTKSARSVPEPVSQAVSMPLVEGVDLNFAFQFDRPFLLAETGSLSAQVIGSLTNVTLLHEAVREANRRRSEANQKLKVRDSDVERYIEQAQQYADLPEEQVRLTEVETALFAIEEDQRRLDSLQARTSRLREAEDELARIEIPPEPADLNEALDDVERQVDRVRSLRSLRAQTRDLAQQIVEQVEQAKQSKAAVAEAEQEYQDLLHELGRCPTCDQVVA